MLSKISTLILGILEEKPVNPYEINKFLDIIKIKDWFPVAPSSVYATIKTLNSKGFISGESLKEGNMPEKTIYSITDKGKKNLHKTLEELLSSKELDSQGFNIATILMCHLEKESVLKLLAVRLKKIQEEQSTIKMQYEFFKNIEQVPEFALISLKHNMYLYEAEQKTTIELMEELSKNNEWNHFLTLK
jgi:DNA-binding PadR family transcriptional regulator